MDFSGLVITVLGVSFQLTSQLYNYAQQVKGARRDIQALSNELFSLVGALEQLKRRQDRIVDKEPPEPPRYAEKDTLIGPTEESANKDIGAKTHQATVTSVLSQTLEFLKELQQILREPKGRFHAKVQLLKWPFKEGDMQTHLKRLERVKTYFILLLVTDEADQTRIVVDEIAALRTLVQETNDNRDAVRVRLKHRNIQDWLSPVDPSLTRYRINQGRTPGTGTWFTSSKSFRVWRDSAVPSSQIFWLNGITGAGKSFLMTAVINDLVSMEPSLNNIAYFYCSFSNERSLHPYTIMGSLLAQICGTSDLVYHELESRFDEYMSKQGAVTARRLELNDSTLLLLKQVESKEKTYIIIDGINECSDPIELLQALKTITKSSTCVRIMLSSINEKDIESCLSEMPNLSMKTLNSPDIEKDVNLLVHSSLSSHPRLRQLSPSLKDDIASAMGSGAQGMFRWVQCQLDLLSRLRTPGAVRKALVSLPPTLDKTYEEILSRIDGEEDRALTRQILEILAFAFQPFSLSDVCEILQITPGVPTLDESRCLTHPNDILSICGSLLNHNKESNIVTLAHHSVKSYLLSPLRGPVAYFKLSEQEGHRSMALYCLTYLSFDTFSFSRDDPRYPFSTLFPNSAFLSYTTQYWPLHTKAAEPLDETLWSALKSFLLSGKSGRKNFVNWVHHLIPGNRNADSTPPLYYAASFGLTTVVEYLLDMGADAEAPGGRAGATPINIAAYRGNTDVVELLLERGADPSVPDGDGLSAVQWALIRRHKDISKLFEQKGHTLGVVRSMRHNNIAVASVYE